MMRGLSSFLLRSIVFASLVVAVRRIIRSSENKSFTPIYVGHEFDALKARFQDQVGLLVELTKIDLQVFSGYITIQLALGGWFSQRPLTAPTLKVGMLLIDLSLAVIAGWLILNNYRRRQEVVGTVNNLNRALGYSVPGVYLQKVAINAPSVPRYWAKAYFVGIVVAAVGVALILLNAPAVAPRKIELTVPGDHVIRLEPPSAPEAQTETTLPEPSNSTQQLTRPAAGPAAELP